MGERDKARVLIAGGGFAAVEAALALRALAGEKVTLTLIAPDPVLRYHPAATQEAFQQAPPRGYDLRAIAVDLGAAYRKDRLESVAPQKRYVRTASGARLGYDALFLAIGARAIHGIPGAPTFRDQRDVWMIERLLGELEAGKVRRVAFAAPSGCSWPLPLYELAFLTAKHARERGIEAEVSLVTPEPEPLAPFGPGASRLLGAVLAECGVRFLGGTAATCVRRDGSLEVAFDGAIGADRVVAVPQLRGRRLTGVPASWWGFVPVDAFGRVEDLTDVYAAGDMTTFPVKQGGLAGQQADRIAHTIAASMGAGVKELHVAHVLQALVIGGDSPLFLRTELDWQGRPTAATLERTEREWASSFPKVFGRYLAPYLETVQPLAA